MKHSLAPLQDLIPTLASSYIHTIYHDAKVGIKSCRGAREYVSFVHVCTYVATVASCNSILEQTHAVYNAAWVLSDSYIANYLFPYFLCRSLLPFLNSKFFITLVVYFL